MTEEMGLTITRACSAARLSPTAFYRAGIDRVVRDRPVMEALNEIVAVELRWGLWKCYDRRHLGRPWNHKRVHRVYCEMRLNQVRRTKKRVPKRERVPFLINPKPNAVWAIDYMHDALYGGRAFRCFNVVDEAHRGGLGIEIAMSLPAARIIRVLDELVELYGCPAGIRCDNGPEFLSKAFTDWCQAEGIKFLYIQPGKPDQNAIIERFNGSFRREVLDAHLFESIVDAREIAGTGCAATTRSVHTIRWEACRQRSTARKSSRSSPAWNCLLDGGAYAPIQDEALRRGRRLRRAGRISRAGRWKTARPVR